MFQSYVAEVRKLDKDSDTDREIRMSTINLKVQEIQQTHKVHRNFLLDSIPYSWMGILKAYPNIENLPLTY